MVFNTCQLAHSQCWSRNIVQTHGQWWLWSLKGFVAAEGNGRIGGREKSASSGEKKEWCALEQELSPAPWPRQWVLSSFLTFFMCGNRHSHKHHHRGPVLLWVTHVSNRSHLNIPMCVPLGLLCEWLAVHAGSQQLALPAHWCTMDTAQCSPPGQNLRQRWRRGLLWPEKIRNTCAIKIVCSDIAWNATTAL